MSTALFGMLKAVGREDLIVGYLDNSSYDELIELDIPSNTFRQLYHTSKKYSAPLNGGAVEKSFDEITNVLVHPDDRERFALLLDPQTMLSRLEESEQKGLVCEQFRFSLLSGSWRWVEIVATHGEAYGQKDVCRLYIFDIHAQKARELGFNPEPLFYSGSGSRNETTGLPNRRAFTKSVNKVLKNTTVEWCLIAIDIENFKLFNEWYGHSEGDMLMTQIGLKLRRACEEHGGVAGYFGQDDFCLLTPYNIENIEKLYNDIMALIASHGSAIGFMPAFGVAKIEDSQSKVRDLLDRAFLAAGYAKQSFHNRIRMFESGMYRRTDEEYHILSDFVDALKRGEIKFWLQPQCRVSSGKIVGAEALARWMTPDGTMVPPDVFIPVLEKHGLITDLDLYIWEEVCRWQRQWIDRGNTPLPVSVNVSAMDMLSSDLASTFNRLVQKYDLPRELLKIEITESAYIGNEQLVTNAVQGLRDEGFTVLMDDFGNRYSTLNLLKNINIDVIKLDAHFLRMNETNAEKSIRILESVASMTQILGIPIIVEGVETEQQKEFLKDIGCRYIQGYYYYRPMPADSYENLICDSDKIDPSGITFKATRQFRISDLLDSSVYSDNMLNNILGPSAIYALRGDSVEIVRFNEQFYETVDVPDLQERLSGIERFMPPSDRPLIVKMLRQAHEDRLNGAKGVLHFYKTDGTLTSYHMRFFYLRTEVDLPLFYGTAQDITRLTVLERQMALLSRCSPDTVVFLRRNPDDGSMRFSVLFNGLEKQTGLTRGELEKELNGDDFTERIFMEDHPAIYRELIKRILNSESFIAEMNVTCRNGNYLELTVYGDYVLDTTGTLDYILTLRSNTKAEIIS